jgi:lysophospholipase L1-like esterase
VAQVRPDLRGLILMTPYFLQPDPDEPMRALMDQFGSAVREVASKHEALLVNTQACFDPVMTQVNPLNLAADRVHLNLAGHMILARAFLRRIEFSWDRNIEPNS